MKLLPIATTLLFLSCPASHADFWPQFRGPQGQGHAPGAEVPLRWSTSENVRWKVAVAGKAWSSPVVGGDRIYLTTAVEEGGDLSLRAQARDLESGATIWDREVFRTEAGPMHRKNSQASPTPILADGRLYLHFGHLGTACLETDDGAAVWTRDDLEYPPVHGNGGSPALFEDRLIFSCDGARNPEVVALDRADGSVLWRTPRNVEVKRTFSFSTPLVIQVDGASQVVLPGSGAVIAYDPADGGEIWRFRYGEGYSVVPRPLFRDGILYVCSGFNRASLYAIRVDGKGDVTDSHLVWMDDKAVPKESSPILVGGSLYMNDDKGILSCLDAKTGEEIYRERLDGQGGYSASPVYTSGHLFFHNGEGITTVVRPGPTFEKVAENSIGEYGLSSFAVVSDGFVLRTENHLIRVGE